MAWHGVVKRGKAGEARLGVVSRGGVWRGLAGQAGCGVAGFGEARLG
jgi:hypothetical protein